MRTAFLALGLLLLAALAVQFVLDGLERSLPGLAG